MDLKIKQLKLFLTLAETLHFGKTAEMLYMSQPTLTFQIQSLEAAVGIELFNRDRRHVELTEAGKSLVITANRILGELRLYQENVSSISTERQLRLVCGPSGEQVILPAIIRRMKEISPQSRIDICGMSSIEQVRALKEKRVDVLLMMPYIDTPGITFQVVSNQQMYAVVPENSIYAKRGSISVHEFVEHPVVVTARQYCDRMQPLIQSLFAPYGLVPRFLEAPDRKRVHEAMVAAGMGVTLNTEWRLQAPFPGVAMVPFEETIQPLQLGVAWRTSFQSNVLNSFKIALDDVIRDLGKQKRPPIGLSLPAATQKTA